MQARSWITVLKFVLLTVAALICADLVSTIMKARMTPAPPTTPKGVVAQNSAPLALSESEAVQESRTLLGDAADITRQSAKSSASPSAANPTSATSKPAVAIPDPAQTMTLLGTVVCPGASLAIVSVSGQEQFLHERDTAGTFVVKEIRDASVLLEMSGQTRTLWMPSFAPPAANGQPPQNVGVLPPPPAPVPATNSGGRSIVSRSERDKAMGNLDQSLKDLRILPFKKNGTDYGARVEYLNPGSFLSKTGLQQGDVLLSVNNQPVNNAEQGLAVFQAFKMDEKIVMKIDRNGQVMQQEVDFR